MSSINSPEEQSVMTDYELSWISENVSDETSETTEDSMCNVCHEYVGVDSCSHCGVRLCDNCYQFDDKNWAWCPKCGGTLYGELHYGVSDDDYLEPPMKVSSYNDKSL